MNIVATFSTIDHLAISALLLANVEEAGVIHSGENASNHSAIYVKLNVGQLNLQLEVAQNITRSNWAHASNDAKLDFKSCLTHQLHNLPKYECTFCHDFDFVMDIHRQGIPV